MSARGKFDAQGFFGALDAVRISRNMNWKEVAAKADVSASTLTRMGQGKRPDVDSLASLVNWSGLSADDFVQGEREQSDDGLAQILVYARGDKNLSGESADAFEAVVKAAYESLRDK